MTLQGKKILHNSCQEKPRDETLMSCMLQPDCRSEKTEMKGGCFLNRLDVFINVGAEEHAQNGQKVHFEEKAQGKFYQD